MTAFALRALPTFGCVTLACAAACGGQSKPADAPSACPEGTVLRGADCVPTNSGESAAAPAPSNPSAPNVGDTGETSAKPPYDRDAVESELKRGARQVKANCGAATDDDGQASGPWGQTKASVVLGRNGHVRRVTVPDPYSGKPVGICIVHSFEKIQFPPYAASSDVTVDWEVDLVQPKR